MKHRIASLLLLTVLSAPALACPTCKQSIAETDVATSGLAEGFAYSIVLMLSTPPLILVSLGTMFYLQIQRHRQQEMAASGEDVGTE